MQRKIIGSFRNLTPWDIYVRSCLICGLLAATIFGLSLQKTPHLPLSSGKLEFNAQQSYDYTKTLSKEYPFRLPWHENRLKAGDWLIHEFKRLGYDPKEMPFSETIAGKKYTDLRNIYAEKIGTVFPNEVILVTAHYDTTDTTIEGAADDASGVGIVLELARIFAKKDTRRSMVFLLTDSEEFGNFWGARVFSKNYERKDQIIAVVGLDFVAPETQVAVLQMHDGLKEGFTPLWLRELALDSLRSVGGFEVREFTHIAEFASHAIQVPASDHGPFLQAGIPAFNWVGQSEDFTRQMSHFHHTKHDVMEALQVRSFEQIGKSAERLFRSLDALASIPKNFRESDYWKISTSYYISKWPLLILQILAFIPFLVYSLFRFGISLRSRSKSLIRRVFKNEIKNVAIISGSFLMGYALVRLLPELKIITQYEAFPATQKSAILYDPDYLVLGIVAAFVLLTYWIFKKTFREKEDDQDYREIRHAFHAIFLVIIIVLAFIGNSYLAVLLLMPPAYLWTILRAKQNAQNRIFNFLLLMGGTITFVAFTVILSTVFHLGVMYWFLFLATAYGLISVYSIFVFTLAVALMIRLFRSFVLR